MPQFSADLSVNRYKFDVQMDDNNNTITHTGSSPERNPTEDGQLNKGNQVQNKIEMFRKVQEAHLLLNALPTHIRDAELERARHRQAEQ